MNGFIAMSRTLAATAVMFAIAPGAQAQDAMLDAMDGGDDTIMIAPAPEGEEVLEFGNGGIADTGVVGEEEVPVGEDVVIGEGEVVDGEEVMFYTMGEPDAEVTDGGEVLPDGFTDGDGNVIYFVSDGVDSDGEMVPLMAQSGAAGAVYTISDTTAEQGGIESGMDMGLDVVAGGQAGFAGPIDVTATAQGVTAASQAGGRTTRISGGHLAAPTGQ